MDRLRSFLAKSCVTSAALGLPLCLALLAAPGCTLMQGSSNYFGPGAFGWTNDEPVCRIECLWDRGIRWGMNTKDNGKEFPGLFGQIYFFGVDPAHSIAPQGQLVAEWYDATKPIADDAKPLHTQVYEAGALQQMKQKGLVGPRYAMFLDWPNYRPEIKQVLLKVHLK